MRGGGLLICVSRVRQAKPRGGGGCTLLCGKRGREATRAAGAQEYLEPPGCKKN